MSCMGICQECGNDDATTVIHFMGERMKVCTDCAEELDP